MIKQLKYKNVIWLDVDRPSHEELEDLETKGLIPTEVAFNLEKPERRPKFAAFDRESAYISLPVLNSEADKNQEIKFWLKKDTLITIHDEHLPIISDFAQILNINANSKKEKDFHSGQLFYLLLCKLYLPYETELTTAKSTLKKLEKNLAKAKPIEISENITNANIFLIEIESNFKNQRPILEELGQWGEECWGTKFSRYREAILDEHDHIVDLAQQIKDIATRLQEECISLKSDRHQRVLKLIVGLISLFLLLAFLNILFSLK